MSLPAPPDWATAEGAQAFIDYHKDYISRCFDKDGYVHPFAFLLGRRHPQTRLTFKGGPQILIVAAEQLATNAHKDNYSDGIRLLAKRSSAIAAAFVTEGWMLRHRTPESLADYDANWRGRLSEHPDRMEIVQLVWQHRKLGNGTSLAEILRPADGKPHLDAWTDISSAAHPSLDVEGRFTSFLPSEDT